MSRTGRRPARKTAEGEKLLQLFTAQLPEEGGGAPALAAGLRELKPSAHLIHRVLADVPHPESSRMRDIGVVLLAYEDRYARLLGLALIARARLPFDTEAVRAIGMSRPFTHEAVAALETLPDPVPDLLSLAERMPPADRQLRHVLPALVRRADDPRVREWLLHHPEAIAGLAPSTARQIAEAVRLLDLLRERPDDIGIVDQTLGLLARMTSWGDYRAEIRHYPDARALFLALAAAAPDLPPSLDRAAQLTSLVQELYSGHSGLLDMTPRRHGELLDALCRPLRRPDWTELVRTARASAPHADQRHRAAWIERTLARCPTDPPGLRIAVAVPDPAHSTQVETRILVDGHPVVADAFDAGPAHAPEYLLDPGLLRATDEPHEVELAEAYCTEGCCGALYVTVVREGDTVVWRDWHRSKSTEDAPIPPALRFDAAAYDAEVERATEDHSWEWPGRTLARLVRERLRDEPELVRRWDCRLIWVGTHHAEPGVVKASFIHPASARHTGDDPYVQLLWSFADDGTPPAAQAEAVVRRLRREDLTTFAHLSAGTPGAAAALGFE
ncbi:hypothetical protein [Streptomyces sp. NBC_01304]|uniref:hypothetical protein n=1 Tax=Streptomyces sp. NBC_01304 TaxID=2903818 RepID=UPI002E13310F|nr:hypothetical protein OG430_09705 [Streptomyces sp. NBC_01304]